MVSAPPPITMAGGGGGLNIKICHTFVVTTFFLTFLAG